MKKRSACHVFLNPRPAWKSGFCKRGRTLCAHLSDLCCLWSAPFWWQGPRVLDGRPTYLRINPTFCTGRRVPTLREATQTLAPFPQGKP